MSNTPCVSVIVSSYNYERFLNQAIDSALNQTYSNVEVIVVDDGSTDNSRDIIAGYGDRVTAVMKENGGQASAFNAGFHVSRGEVIIFLDSDNALYPTAAEIAADLMLGTGVTKVHWPLRTLDEFGRDSGRVFPHHDLPEGDLRQTTRKDGPCQYEWPPTSGNAWSRRFIQSIFPMPEEEYKVCPDIYLSVFSAACGPIKKSLEPQAYWRIHGSNNSWREPFDERIATVIQRWDHCFKALQSYYESNAIQVDPETWKAASWSHRIHYAVQDIRQAIPSGSVFILVDEDQWETSEIVGGCRRVPFPEHKGQYWGPPSDDESAIRELDRLRQLGVDFIVFAWPAFWWLDHYSGLHQHLEARYRRILENDRLIIFNLQS